MTDTLDHQIIIEVYVDPKVAVRDGYARFGYVPLIVDLRELTADQRKLLAEWGDWKAPTTKHSGPWPVLRHTKHRWKPKTGKCWIGTWDHFIAEKTPPTIDDVFRGLEKRRDFEPENLRLQCLYEKEHDERVEVKTGKRRWWQRRR